MKRHIYLTPVLAVVMLLSLQPRAEAQNNRPFKKLSEVTFTGTINDAAIADFTGDGQADLYIARHTGGPLARENLIVANMGNGKFLQQTNEALYYYREPTLNATPSWSVAAADFNGDTLTDLVVGTWENGPSDVWLRQPGNPPTFLRHPVTFAPGQRIPSIRVADFDGDTHPDIVAATSNGGASAVYLNDGTGGFAAPHANLASNAQAVEVGHLVLVQRELEYPAICLD